ncbi:SDR family NAD(P)-dependent oxidoreductase [Amycolatopsis sp. lyj-346]|uniref:SDR family NAD(P)-dependent oxidoreductase n=1 Tax=Amycolatopsis sp. lyj-346 TaxID=2789289 RepID=UPI00397DB867
MTTATRPLAVVTGASSGIGLEPAKQFARHDFDLVPATEDAEPATAADEVRACGAVHAAEFFERADMTDTKLGAGPQDPAAEAGFDALMAGEVKAKQQGKPSEPGSAEA